MSHPTLFTQAQEVRYGTITIPATGGTAKTLTQLGVAAATPVLTDEEATRVIGCIVQSQGITLDYVFGNSAASLPCTVKAYGPDFTLPAIRFGLDTFVKSSGIAISAGVIFLLRGN